MIRLSTEQKEFNKDIANLVTLNKLLKQHCTNFAFMGDRNILMQSNVAGVKKFARLRDENTLCSFNRFYFSITQLTDLGKIFKKSKNYGKIEYSSNIGEVLFKLYDEDDAEVFTIETAATVDNLKLLSDRTYTTVTGRVVEDFEGLEYLDFISVDDKIVDDLIAKKLCHLNVEGEYLSTLWFNKNILAAINKTDELEYVCVSETRDGPDLFVQIIFRQRFTNSAIPVDIYTFVGYIHNLDE